MNHTKGEWKVLKTTGKICIVTKDKGIAYMSEGNTYTPIEETLANAHLIAAAPESYKACKAIHKYFKACVVAWAANDGKLVDDKGASIVEADGLDELSDIAARLAFEAIAKVKGGKR